MSQSFWKIYKAKVLQTFNAEQDGETHEESESAEIIEAENLDNGGEELNMSHFARKVQGAFGWRSVTSLFTKEEEQRTDQKVEERPEQTVEQSPLSHPPDNPPQKKPSALWDVFSSRWHQSTAERSEARGVLSEPPDDHNEAQQAQETPFRWSFLTSKLADLTSKSD
ncbi:uncharacterized protein C1orf232 homolog [Mixophyes fleayi]|uniref:uncharacterized protein C1orf232 homolog n=1 Tax=Mixophyes fleayi TaxID=3061075 RepID=UPI003F4E3C7E